MMSLAYVFFGIFLIYEGASKLGATMWQKDIVQGICLLLGGILVFIDGVRGLF